MSNIYNKEVIVYSLTCRDVDATKIALGSLFLVVFGLIFALGWGGFILSVGIGGLFITFVEPSDDWDKKHND